uniref:C-type lectin domain-containing protein n=1 Tax=Neogobius melanostomus TaxID=47308 RepID=A0A8C6SSY8_9GOBI
ALSILHLLITVLFCLKSMTNLCLTQSGHVFTGSTDGPKQYTYISTRKSWEDARSYCRQHHTDLAMIEDESENTAVASVLVSNQWAWMGLYRQAWRWSDDSDSQFTNWQSGEPNNVGGAQHCVLKFKSHQWNDRSCSNKHKFICHKGEVLFLNVPFGMFSLSLNFLFFLCQLQL